MLISRVTLLPQSLARICALISIASIGTAVLPFVVASPAAAQIIYEEGAPNQFSAFTSDAGPGGNGFLAAETFSLDVSATFNTVEWYGTYGPANTPLPTDAFTILFFNTTGGVPDATAIAGLSFNVGNAVHRTATGQTVSDSFTEYSHSSTLSGSVSLPAGTYGVSIVNDTTADDNDVWSWEGTGPIPGGQHYFRQTPNEAWSSTTNNLSFRVLEVITAAPEPGSIALLAIVGLPLVGIRLHRGKFARVNQA